MCMEDGVDEHVEIRNVATAPSTEPTLAELRAVEAKLQKEWLKRVRGTPWLLVVSFFFFFFFFLLSDFWSVWVSS